MGSRSEPIYGQEGACEVGRNSWLSQVWTQPFAGLYIYRDELVLSMSFRRYPFSRDQISQIRRYRSGLSRGLKIEHTVSEYPPFMVFYPQDIDEFEEALDANAFPVAAHSV
jgi:hypothetical protein